jgi:hypothetical protein
MRLIYIVSHPHKNRYFCVAFQLATWLFMRLYAYVDQNYCALLFASKREKSPVVMSIVGTQDDTIKKAASRVH